MSEPQGLYLCERVDRPYEKVRDLLHQEPLGLLQRATKSAAPRTDSPLATLHMRLGAIEIGVDIRVRITRIRDQPGGSNIWAATRLDLSFEATGAPSLFPTLLGELSAQPVSVDETLLQLDGSYWLPLGRLGDAIDAAVGRRVTEQVVRRLLADLAAEMRTEIAP